MTTTAERMLDNQAVLSLADVAQILGVRPGAVRSQVKRGVFPLEIIKIGGGVKGYVRTADVRALLFGGDTNNVAH
jgi:hypothetical protein